MSTSNSVYDIIIIGCGPAGIAAGLEFQKYSFIPNFLILEARNRVGGRAYTDTHTFNSSEPIDLGARWIHHYRPENPLALHHTPSDKDQFFHHFFHGSNTAFYDIDGSSLSETLLNEAEKFVDDLCETIKQYSSDKEDISMLDIIRHKFEKIQDEQMRRLVEMNLAYIEHYEASNLDQLSVKSYTKSDGVEQNPLPIQLNTIVTNIDIPNDKNEPIRITKKDNRHCLTKHALITIPLGCLKATSIQFTPPLPDWKQNAIGQMGVDMGITISLKHEPTYSPKSIFTCSENEELISFEEVNRIAYKKLTKSKCKISKKKTSASNKVEEEEEIENEFDDDDKNEEQHQLDKRYSENNTTNEDEESMLIDEFDFDVLPEVSSSTVNGMRIFDSIDNCQNESFFSVEVNGQKKYLHKQTANWYFSKTKPISSSDRLKRVQEKK
ncbi:unnamed protein product [Rotaria magnacalcarata]|uniref:Amine oxidase domain-containing protein n=2 Tax=Rotaria magnacalcarata TaxID=392030 RepID=A0A816Y3L8_9BILA|nr:unnamed protein product [Rotaria magnacalcarata]CAF2056192.1 unnamed protein product [Rotaria magnacalcarata]CAF2154965.1 unnamed protein product [Rotaria magnacalcarata]CAF3761220.1 unnamed protein product [Rotaria magnacalcarata]CAF3807476.1 unnamed protein product [Rotaria magnacalcarata]